MKQGREQPLRSRRRVLTRILSFCRCSHNCRSFSRRVFCASKFSSRHSLQNNTPCAETRPLQERSFFSASRVCLLGGSEGVVSLGEWPRVASQFGDTTNKSRSVCTPECPDAPSKGPRPELRSSPAKKTKSSVRRCAGGRLRLFSQGEGEWLLSLTLDFLALVVGVEGSRGGVLAVTSHLAVLAQPQSKAELHSRKLPAVKRSLNPRPTIKRGRPPRAAPFALNL